jgi:hypothetical protein
MVVAAGALAVASVAGAADKEKESKAPPAAKMNPKQKAQVQRGEYLVNIGGCGDCHTPHAFNPEFGMPLPDMTRNMAGHPADGTDPRADPAVAGGPPDSAVIGASMTAYRFPFGTVYAANLTPDKETGLGSWTEENFVKAMRTGKHMGGTGRVILPPMPWPSMARMTDEDLKAVFAYLRTLPPVKNAVPQPKVPPPVLDQMSTSLDKMMKAMSSQHH